ncbi:single-stranded DNA-binding protein [Rummeliibacillus stabekisii]|uniref:single-stranded DNA-binding protein n=1 Tax=Rummeliibacillus stabekisii TaxID=241244 RepID=UPI00371BEA9B
MQVYMATGRLTKDPVLSYTDKAKCKFFIATEVRRGSFKRTDFIPCVAWKELAEIIANYTKKGSLVSIKGELRSHMQDLPDGSKRMHLELEVMECDFL